MAPGAETLDCADSGNHETQSPEGKRARRCHRIERPGPTEDRRRLKPHQSSRGPLSRAPGRARRQIRSGEENAMNNVIVVIGAGSIGQAIARRVSAGKHLLLADLRQENTDAAARVLKDAGYDV